MQNSCQNQNQSTYHNLEPDSENFNNISPTFKATNDNYNSNYKFDASTIAIFNKKLDRIESSAVKRIQNEGIRGIENSVSNLRSNLNRDLRDASSGNIELSNNKAPSTPGANLLNSNLIVTDHNFMGSYSMRNPNATSNLNNINFGNIQGSNIFNNLANNEPPANSFNYDHGISGLYRPNSLIFNRNHNDNRQNLSDSFQNNNLSNIQNIQTNNIRNVIKHSDVNGSHKKRGDKSPRTIESLYNELEQDENDENDENEDMGENMQGNLNRKRGRHSMSDEDEDDYDDNSYEDRRDGPIFRAEENNKIKSIKSIIDSNKKIKKEKEREIRMISHFNNDNNLSQISNLRNNIRQNDTPQRWQHNNIIDEINEPSSCWPRNSFGSHNLIDLTKSNVSDSQQVNKRLKTRTKGKLRGNKRAKKTPDNEISFNLIKSSPKQNSKIPNNLREYLLKDGRVKEDEILNRGVPFINHKLKLAYHNYREYGRSNENKLSFGRNPEEGYRDLSEQYLTEIFNQRKSSDAKATIESIKKSKLYYHQMNDLSDFCTTLPVVSLPKELRKNPTRKILDEAKANEISGNSNRKSFKCEVCEQEGKEQYFNTGQGLGGHMSRVHKGKSDKFNKKKEIRDKREDFRSKLYVAKKKMLLKAGLNYEELSKTREGKQKIKKHIKENREEYRRLVRELRRDTST